MSDRQNKPCPHCGSRYGYGSYGVDTVQYVECGWCHLPVPRAIAMDSQPDAELVETMSAEQVQTIRNGESDVIQRLCDSHEELRKRLADAEERLCDAGEYLTLRHWNEELRGKVAGEQKARQDAEAKRDEYLKKVAHYQSQEHNWDEGWKSAERGEPDAIDESQAWHEGWKCKHDLMEAEARAKAAAEKLASLQASVIGCCRSLGRDTLEEVGRALSGALQMLDEVVGLANRHVPTDGTIYGGFEGELAVLAARILRDHTRWHLADAPISGLRPAELGACISVLRTVDGDVWMHPATREKAKRLLESMPQEAAKLAAEALDHERLANWILQAIPGQIARGDPHAGESAAEVAIRVITERGEKIEAQAVRIRELELERDTRSIAYMRDIESAGRKLSDAEAKLSSSEAKAAACVGMLSCFCGICCDLSRRMALSQNFGPLLPQLAKHADEARRTLSNLTEASVRLLSIANAAGRWYDASQLLAVADPCICEGGLRWESGQLVEQDPVEKASRHATALAARALRQAVEAYRSGKKPEGDKQS